MRLTLSALLLALAATGCGTSDDREQARGAVLRFNHALEEGRGSAACAELSAATVAELESRSGLRCARAVTALTLEGGEVIATEVYLTNARVELSSGENAYLGRAPSGWKIGAVGCKPEEGKPRDRPLDCEVEA